MNQRSDSALEELDALYRLTPEQIGRYQQQGFIRLEDVLSESLLQVMKAEITQVVRDWTQASFIEQIARDNGPELAERVRRASKAPSDQGSDTYARAFTQRMNLWRRSAAIARLVHAPRLAQLATELMQSEGVRLYHDQALFKEAGGGHTPWHVDQFYWPLSSEKTVTAWIPLQAVSPEMGPLTFAVGSHAHGAAIARDLSISDESESVLAAALADFELAGAPFSLGEVSFHSGWTCHRAGPNTTDRTRAAFTIIYMDKDMRMIEPEHANHAADARMWLPGISAGELAASPINPVLAPPQSKL